MAEPFTEMLTDMVHRVDGAIGAAFMDNYGEAVQSFSTRGDEEYIRLMGAYQGLSFQTSRNICSQLEAGDLDYFYTSYEDVSFLVKALKQDYYLMLVLGSKANIGQGLYSIRRAAAAFDAEI